MPGWSARPTFKQSIDVLRSALVAAGRHQLTREFGSLSQLANHSYGDWGSLAKRLIDDAIALGEAEQCCELFCQGVSIEIKLEPDPLETHWHILGHAERSAKIKVALGAHLTASQLHADGGRHGH